MKKISCTVNLSLEQVQSFLDREFTGYTVEVCSGTDGIDIFYRYAYYETVSNLYLAVELIEQSSPLEVKKMKSFYEWKQEMLCRYDTMPAWWWQHGMPEKAYKAYEEYENRIMNGTVSSKCV